MRESPPESEVLPDAKEFSVLNHLLDKRRHLTWTVDTDIARHPVWRHVTKLIEDLEPSNPSICGNPNANSKTPKTPHLGASVFGNQWGRVIVKAHDGGVHSVVL